MKYFKRLVLVLVVALLISSQVYADASCANWCSVRINQTGVGHAKGCTTVTLQLILQNSKTLPSEYQLSGDITSATAEYTKFDNDTSSFHSDDSWKIGSFASGASSLSGASWTSSADVSGQSLDTADYSSVKAIVGLGSKDFKDMSYSEQVSAMKVFWNAGYFVAFCVEYKGVGQESNGPAGHKASHATMLAGVDESDIYINDPANGKVCLYKDRSAKGGKYNLMYVVLFKNDKTAPNTLSTGGNAPVTEDDEDNADSIGITPSMVKGYYTEDQLSAYLRLNEVNIQDMFLNSATRENLDQSSLGGLSNWERNVNNNDREDGFIAKLRIVTMWFGIMFLIWVSLIYIAYWFDRLNSLFYIDLLSILTFGQLHISENEDECTFHLSTLNKAEKKTVNHKAILFICITGILFGTLIVTGGFYTIIAGFVNFVLRLLS